MVESSNTGRECVELRVAIAQLVDLIEGWAYGPLLEKAGVIWPTGKCQAPALVKAKEILARESQA